ncbi:MAG: hypothetical protein EPO21_04270 [Chloroflexota bacterium]|nr:MAG: hypothetical protein EPO21_04270 [Chloroflexota bacterium]
MKSGRTFLVVVAALLVAVLAVAGIGTASAWDPTGQNGTAVGSMMGGSGGMMGSGPGGMMGGSGMMSDDPGGMMGGWAAQTPQNQGTPISLDKAVEAAQTYVERMGNKDLVVTEVMEFQNNFYAIVKEKSTGTGAFELLINRYTGAVHPEMGPNMMWNTKYGHMTGEHGGMMGGTGGTTGDHGMMGDQGMMGGQDGMMGGPDGMMGDQGMMGGQYGPTAPTTTPTVTAEQAQAAAQAWLDQYQPDSTIHTSDQFYGYYTLHTLKDGKVTGMLSVNAYSGQVWYHAWHGDFVQAKTLGQ